MINTALIATFWSKQPFFLCRSTKEHVHSILLDEKFLYSEHEVVRGVAGAHPPFGPVHLRYVEPGCALVGTRPAL